MSHEYKKIEFYYMPESPPCRLVEMLASHIGIRDRLNKNLIDLSKGEQHSNPEIAKLNPLKKLPIIKDGDMVLTEGRVICMYLVEKYGTNKRDVYPIEIEKRLKVDELIHQDATFLWPAASKLFRPVLFHGAKTLDEEAETQFHQILSYLENKLEDPKQYMLGENITLADMALLTTFSFVESFDYDISKYEKLSSYITKLKKDIPEYNDINDKPVNTIRQLVKAGGLSALANKGDQ